MELTQAMSMAMVLVVTFAVLALSSVVWPRRSRRKKLNLPPGPRGWPVFGSLLTLLSSPLPPHRVLAALAARHGAPLMHLKLGSFHVVVASSEETARLVLKTHDLAFADRPPTAFGEILGYGYKGIVQTPYGPYWRMARKLCATELFSTRRVEAFEHARAQEMRALTRGLFERAGEDVQVKEHLLSFTMRNILRMALGERWSSGGSCGSSDAAAAGEAFRRTLKESFTVTGLLGNVGEWVPWLGWFDVQGYVRGMKKAHVMFDKFNEQILVEHEKDYHRRRRAGTGNMDLVDVLLELVADDDGDKEEEESPETTTLTRDGVKAFLLDIIGGGTETAAAIMEWAIVELLRHPDAMAAATGELDRVVGNERWATESDLPDLPYVEAVVKETMRLHPVGPLLIPHHAREDTVVVAGDCYDIPAGTRLMVNMWAVGRDPASWPESPEEFRPERFLAGGGAEGVDVRGAHFKLLPFGAGRRMCPAYNLVMKEVVAAMANLVHGFSWRLPDGVVADDLSMEEFFGLNVSRKEPLLAVVEPRMPAHLYDAVD
ncbi:hypothetical protein HU200_003387 [Digitaria exilis]|uniref:trimethyltridecatetraene synthase n=1 Tax=Digitaria exilis TaxID=1010633 RepID=A0A835FVC2_9POAL|nr:hypothetical protein HU200_003387 [Digitaria exilis]